MATNGNGYVNDEARYAALSQRVTGIENSVNNLSTQFSTFVAKLDERQRTPWGLMVSIAVAILAYVTTIGGLAYAPVWTAINRIESTASSNNTDIRAGLQKQAELTQLGISKLADTTQASIDKIATTMITRQEMEWRQARSAEDRARTDAAVKDLRDAQVPRAELERVWASDDQQRQATQKQIDELKVSHASTYSARDLLLDMRERLDRLDRQIYGNRPSNP